MEKNSLVLPGAILAAGAMIGAGLFLGLRSKPVVTEAPPEPAPIVTPYEPESAPPSADPEPAPPAVKAPSSAELREKVTEQAVKALKKHHARIVQECWKPSFKKDPKPAKVTVPFRIIFTAEGTVEVFGVGQVAEPSRADLSSCIQSLKLPLTIPPPGQATGVQLSIALP